MNNKAIQTAKLDWNEQGTPVSREFDDVYFSNQNGLAETRYVFLEGNRLPERWGSHPKASFIVAETGFGTGLNFLTLWHEFKAFKQAHPETSLQHLHFISFEKFPLTLGDLSDAHAHWPELAELAEELRAQWPLPLAGCHRLHLADSHITLDLWFGDVNALLPEVADNLSQKIDAWFLDGFAPSKNPDMWTSELFSGMAKMTTENGTVATFTAAGFVRRGLRDAGFDMAKRKGFGQKREMLVGSISSGISQYPTEPWYHRPCAKDPNDVAIIGGGIATALTAEALMRRSANVTIYCKDPHPAEGASGNRQGALYPLLNHSHPLLSAFFAEAFLYARHRYDTLSMQGIKFDHQWCGVSQLAFDDKSSLKIDQMLQDNWPSELVFSASEERITALSGLPTGSRGVNYPLGGWLCPAQLTHSLIERLTTQGLQVHFGSEVVSLQQTPSGWQLQLRDGSIREHATLVLANGHCLDQYEQTKMLPLTRVRGQVSHAPATPILEQLKNVLCYDGYITPVNSHNAHLCLGASYVRNSSDNAYQQTEQEENLQRLLNCLPNAAWPKEVDISSQQARCGVRSATRDHLPLVGAVPDYDATLKEYHNLPKQIEQGVPSTHAPVYPGLFMLGGLGSRGLCSAPLLAELLAAQIYDEPLPLENGILKTLNPNRIWIRKLLRGRQVKGASE